MTPTVPLRRLLSFSRTGAVGRDLVVKPPEARKKTRRHVGIVDQGRGPVQETTGTSWGFWVSYFGWLAGLFCIIMTLVNAKSMKTVYVLVNIGIGSVVMASHYSSAFDCKVAAYLLNVMSEADFRAHVEKLKQAEPKMTRHVVCHRQKCDSNLAIRAPRKVHEAKLDLLVEGFVDETLSASQMLASLYINEGADDPKLELEVGNVRPAVVMCSFSLDFPPADEAAEQAYKEARLKFQEEHLFGDEKVFHERWSCEGLAWVDRALVILHPEGAVERRPWWMHYELFLAAVAVGLGGPFALLFQWTCRAVDWKVLKHVSPYPKAQWADPIPSGSRLRGTGAQDFAFKFMT